MKKVLLTTTAIVVASAGTAFAAEWETGVSGYMAAGAAISDANGDNGVGIFRDGEFHVNGRLTADNGLTFRARVEVEAFTTGDQIDENWVSVGGSFGTLLIGGNDTAGYETNVAGIGGPAGHIGYSDVFGVSSTAGGLRGGATYGTANDSVGIRYTTPSISGFQAAVSYQPSSGSDGGTDSNSRVFSAAGANEDIYSIGAFYEGDFGDFSFGLSGHYTDQDGRADEQYGFGAKVGFSGFTVAGFYEDDFGNDEFAIGAQYATGPWTVAGGFSDSENNGQIGAAWVTYAAAPGVRFTGGVEYADADNDGQDGDIAGIAYMTLSF